MNKITPLLECGRYSTQVPFLSLIFKLVSNTFETLDFDCTYNPSYSTEYTYHIAIVLSV